MKLHETFGDVDFDVESRTCEVALQGCRFKVHILPLAFLSWSSDSHCLKGYRSICCQCHTPLKVSHGYMFNFNWWPSGIIFMISLNALHDDKHALKVVIACDFLF